MKKLALCILTACSLGFLDAVCFAQNAENSDEEITSNEEQFVAVESAESAESKKANTVATVKQNGAKQAVADSSAKALTKEEEDLDREKRRAERRKKFVSGEHGAEKIIGVRDIDIKQREDVYELKVKVFHMLRVIEDKAPFLKSIFRTKIFDVRLGNIFIGCIIVAFFWLFQKFIADTIFKLASKAFSKVNMVVLKTLSESLMSPTKALIMLIGIKIALDIIVKDVATIVVIGRAFWGIVNIVFFWAIWRIISFAFDMMSERIISKHKAAINLIDLGRRITKFSIIFLCFLAILDMCGANIGAIVASLGIGGAALAFASKDTIANFFGSISLVADRPFVVGDWIIADSIEGTVESIGIRSTKIRTFPQTLVTIPNSVLANVAIDNWSNMRVRREKMTLGFTYSSTPEQLTEIVKDIEKILAENEEIEKGSYVVNFTEFGDSSLNVAVVYYSKRLNLGGFNAVRQRVNIAIMNAAAKRGLSFAFPSRSIYMENALRIENVPQK